MAPTFKTFNNTSSHCYYSQPVATQVLEKRGLKSPACWGCGFHSSFLESSILCRAVGQLKDILYYHTFLYAFLLLFCLPCTNPLTEMVFLVIGCGSNSNPKNNVLLQCRLNYVRLSPVSRSPSDRFATTAARTDSMQYLGPLTPLSTLGLIYSGNPSRRLLQSERAYHASNYLFISPSRAH